MCLGGFISDSGATEKVEFFFFFFFFADEKSARLYFK